MYTKISSDLKVKIVHGYIDDNFTIENIADQLSISKSTVFRILNDESVLADKRTRELLYSKSRIPNATFFDIIDSEEKAYWLGFIYADGNIDAVKRSLTIVLNAKDERHLKRLSDIFGSTNTNILTQRHGKELHHIKCKINNIYLCDSLINKGIGPNKTKNDDSFCVSCVPEELKHHFIRGFMDGDGFISKTYDQIGFVGGHRFLTEIRKTLGFMKTHGAFFQDGNVWRLVWHGVHVTKQLTEWLYKDATIFLDRKYERANIIMQL